jgi:glycosyltransferase involved in cell wall biosynthesis
MVDTGEPRKLSGWRRHSDTQRVRRPSFTFAVQRWHAQADVSAVNSPARSTDLAVLVNGFPRLSETFVLQELLELERRGVNLHLFALRQPEEVVQQDALSELRAAVEYLPEGVMPHQRTRVRLAHAALLLHRRLGYVNGFSDVLASPEFSRTLGVRAALLAHRLLRLGSPPLYVHFAHKPATVGRFAALLAGVPYALSAHAKDIWLTPEAELARKVRDASVVLTCTEQARAQVAGLAEGQTPVHLVHHGVDLKGRRRSPRPGTEGPCLLAVGRLVEKKGHETLLLAAAQLRDRGMNFTLRLVGEGPEWPRLQRLVHELRLADRVVFLGPLSETEVRTEYENADVFALPCRKLANGDQDGLPNVVLEAMAHGLPVVSTRLDGIAEAIVDGESGLLADQDDPAAIARHLARLIEDPAFREQIGEAGRSRVADHFERSANLPKVIDALVEAGIVSVATTGEPRSLRAVA